MADQGTNNRRTRRAAKKLNESKKKGPTGIPSIPEPAGPEEHIEKLWCRPDGVFRYETPKRGDTDGKNGKWIWVCSPLYVIAHTRDANSKSWRKVVQLVDRDNTVHEFVVPNAQFAGDGRELREGLLDRGLSMAPGATARQAVMEYLATADPEERRTCVDRIGWHGNVFVLPGAVYGPEGVEKIVLQSPITEKHCYNVNEDLESWQKEVGAYCIGNSRLVLAVMIALTGPLLLISNETSSGFHIRGASQTGKTTALRVAASVCGGDGASGYHKSWRATSNGLETTALQHNHLLLCVDEIGQVDPREAGDSAYMLANGVGKDRATRSGGIRQKHEWLLVFLSTGEISLEQKMAEAGRKVMAGQEVRLIDIPADVGTGNGIFEELHGFADGDPLARHFSAATATYYGSPIHAYLDKLTRADREAVKAVVKEERSNFVRANVPENASGQVSSVAGRFSVTIAAGRLGVEYGVLPWTVDECREAATKCFQAWLAARGGAGARENQTAVAQVKSFLETHGKSRFVNADEALFDRPVHNRAGYYSKNDDDTFDFFIFTESFRKEVCAGLDFRQVCRELIEKGYLQPRADGKPSSVKRFPDTGTISCYHILGAIFSDDE